VQDGLKQRTSFRVDRKPEGLLSPSLPVWEGHGVSFELWFRLFCNDMVFAESNGEY
jgi:hypothetical protein